MDNHVSETEFLHQFFGLVGGRELGTKNKFGKGCQWFSNNPNEVFDLIEEAKRKKRPVYLSVQPRLAHDVVLGIECLFYDWDFTHKNEKLTALQEEKHKKEMESETKIFLNYLDKRGIIPLVKKTRRGYHIHVYFNKIVQINMTDFDVWKLTYERLQESLLNKQYKYCDPLLIGNLKALARVVFSYHELNGEKIILVDKNLQPTKIRGIDYYREFGLKTDVIKKEYDEAKILVEKERAEKVKAIEDINKRKESGIGFSGSMRPCFTERLTKREMPHQMRLACLLEAYYSGLQSEEEIVQVFMSLRDFKDEITRPQVKWFLDNKVYATHPPYKCLTIQGKNWCLGSDCYKFK